MFSASKVFGEMKSWIVAPRCRGRPIAQLPRFTGRKPSSSSNTALTGPIHGIGRSSMALRPFCALLGHLFA